jgi:hypothetical protein
MYKGKWRNNRLSIVKIIHIKNNVGMFNIQLLALVFFGMLNTDVSIGIDVSK